MNLKQHLDKLKVSADWIGLREVKENVAYRQVRNEKSDFNSSKLDHGMMVEVMVDGQFGYAATNTMDSAAIQTAAEKAVQFAKATASYKIHHFNANVRPKACGQYKTSFEKKADSYNLKDLTDSLIQATAALKVSDKIINRTAELFVTETETSMVSTNGTDINQYISTIGLTLKATAQDGNEIQSRSNGLPYLQQGLEYCDTHLMQEIAERIGQEALELLTAEECPTGAYDLVLTPDQLYLQVHESIGHPLELDRILGDERNYAGWSFVKPHDFGKLQYGSSLLNVTFDPFIKGEAASYAYDDIGHTANREYLIKDGILLKGLGSLESQTRLNVAGVANARACSWNRPPVDRMANINIEPGNSSFEEMIAQVENGILMQTNRSWSIDDYRNKFQFGCEYARRIEKGKLTTVLKNPNYRGISVPFWNNLKAVGNQNTMKIWGSANCGKAEPNQVIRVGHAVPTCLFKNVDVFGGA